MRTAVFLIAAALWFFIVPFSDVRLIAQLVAVFLFQN